MATDLEIYLQELKDDLAQVQTAIARAERQQKYSLDDGQAKQTVDRAQLQTLYDERARLRNEILQIDNGDSSGFYGRPCP